MKVIFIFIILIFLSHNLVAKEKKYINKKNLILVSTTIVNPAVSVGAIVTNAGALQKILSLINVAYTTYRGKSIAEEAISKGIKKNCLFKNIAKNKNFCS